MTNKSADLQIALDHNEPRFNELVIQMDDQLLDINEILNQMEVEASGNDDLMQLVGDLDMAKNDLLDQAQNIADKAMQYARLAKQVTGAAVEERDKAIEELAELEEAIGDIDRGNPLIEELCDTVEISMMESWREFEHYQAVEALEQEEINPQDAHTLAYIMTGVEGLFEDPNAYLPALKRLVLRLEMIAAGEDN